MRFTKAIPLLVRIWRSANALDGSQIFLFVCLNLRFKVAVVPKSDFLSLSPSRLKSKRTQDVGRQLLKWNWLNFLLATIAACAVANAFEIILPDPATDVMLVRKCRDLLTPQELSGALAFNPSLRDKNISNSLSDLEKSEDSFFKKYLVPNQITANNCSMDRMHHLLGKYFDTSGNPIDDNGKPKNAVASARKNPLNGDGTQPLIPFPEDDQLNRTRNALAQLRVLSYEKTWWQSQLPDVKSKAPTPEAQLARLRSSLHLTCHQQGERGPTCDAEKTLIKSNDDFLRRFKKSVPSNQQIQSNINSLDLEIQKNMARIPLADSPSMKNKIIEQMMLGAGSHTLDASLSPIPSTFEPKTAKLIVDQINSLARNQTSDLYIPGFLGFDKFRYENQRRSANEDLSHFDGKAFVKMFKEDINQLAGTNQRYNCFVGGTSCNQGWQNLGLRRIAAKDREDLVNSPLWSIAQLNYEKDLAQKYSEHAKEGALAVRCLQMAYGDERKTLDYWAGVGIGTVFIIGGFVVPALEPEAEVEAGAMIYQSSREARFTANYMNNFYSRLARQGKLRAPVGLPHQGAKFIVNGAAAMAVGKTSAGAASTCRRQINTIVSSDKSLTCTTLDLDIRESFQQDFDPINCAINTVATLVAASNVILDGADTAIYLEKMSQVARANTLRQLQGSLYEDVKTAKVLSSLSKIPFYKNFMGVRSVLNKILTNRNRVYQGLAYEPVVAQAGSKAVTNTKDLIPQAFGTANEISAGRAPASEMSGVSQNTSAVGADKMPSSDSE